MRQLAERLARRPTRAFAGESGFTLLELLIVLVVIPLIIGAVAEALIVSLDTQSSTSNRLSDSVNAQITSEFFIRDVQGASYVTTANNIAPIASTTSALIQGNPVGTLLVTRTANQIVGGSTIVLISGSKTQTIQVQSTVGRTTSIPVVSFTANYSYPIGTTIAFAYAFNAPEVCGPGSAGRFLVGLYHPPTSGATASSTGLDVGYWAEGTGPSTEIDRFSCTLDPTSFTSNVPVKTVMASGPPAVTSGAQNETINASAEVNPAWLGYAAQAGWTSTAAQTQISLPAGSILSLPQSNIPSIPVASTYGFTVGVTGTGATCAPTTTVTSMSAGTCTDNPPITISTTTGPAQVTCKGFDATDFTDCTLVSPLGPPPPPQASNGSAVTQSSVTGVQMSLVEPASSYRFSVLGSPLPGSAALSSGLPGSKSPTLLTLGSGGIALTGFGSGSCSGGAEICVRSGNVFMDGAGCVVPHSYISLASGGSVAAVAPPGTSACNSVGVAPAPGIQNPLASLTCFPQSLATSLGSGTFNGTFSTPGVWTTQLSGPLAPGVYVVEAGIGSISMAPDSGASASYYNGDPNAGVLLVNPGPEDPVTAKCFSFSGAALSGTLSGLVPFDSAQSFAFFGNGLLADVWYWQDALNTNIMAVTGTTAGGAGLAYLPAGTFQWLSGTNSMTTGSMIAGTVAINKRSTLVLNGT